MNEDCDLGEKKRCKTAASRPNERWSMDFVTDSIVTGWRFQALTIVDEYSRESPAVKVDTSLGGRRVVATLERLIEFRGLPQVIENAYAESFNSRFRDECLNTNWFISLKHARHIIEEWRIDYNGGRPRTLLGGLTPREYAQSNRGILTAVGL